MEFVVPSFALTKTGIVEIAVSFVMGFIIGLIARKLFVLAILLVAFFAVLYGVGYLHPSSVSYLINFLYQNEPVAVTKVQELPSIIPFLSLAFIIGFVTGMVKG